MVRYQEGFADYQRVLDAQQALFAQQQRYVSNKGLAIQSLISVYKALGGGWQSAAAGFVDEATRQEMEQRTDWNGLLEMDRDTISEQ
jgi:outer membrane protein TolC